MSRQRRQQKKRARQWELRESKSGRVYYSRNGVDIPTHYPRFSLSDPKPRKT
jgi:hypothetical protein